MKASLVKLLRDARISKGLKQRDVAQYLGIKDNTLSNWETGRTEPDMDTFLKLCDIYDLDAGAVLSSAYGTSKVLESSSPYTHAEKEIIAAYRIASEDDRTIVDSALRKYMSVDSLKREEEKMA